MVNLIQNPGLELGNNGIWQFSSTCVQPSGDILNEPANAHTGSWRMMVRGGRQSTGTQTCGQWKQIVPVELGQVHRFSFWYKIPSLPSGAIFTRVQILGATSGLTYFFFSPSTVQATYLQVLSAAAGIVFGAPDTQASIIVSADSLHFGNLGFANFYYDDFVLEQLTFPRQGFPGFVGK